MFFLLLRLGVIVLPRVGGEFMLVRVYRSRKLVSFDVFFFNEFLLIMNLLISSLSQHVFCAF